MITKIERMKKLLKNLQNIMKLAYSTYIKLQQWSNPSVYNLENYL